MMGLLKQQLEDLENFRNPINLKQNSTNVSKSTEKI